MNYVDAALIKRLEEQARSIGFIMSHKADLAISYDGAGAKEAAE